MQTQSPEELEHVVVYTDGACIGNPGPGGYGAVLLDRRRRKEISGGFRKTTNNRMEILAAIKALESLKERCRVTLHSDSQYLVNAMSKGWAQRWRSRGWKRNKKDKAINPDLWDRLLLCCEYHSVVFKWVRGHSGNPENERCDRLATQAALGKDLAVDEEYQRPAGGVP